MFNRNQKSYFSKGIVSHTVHHSGTALAKQIRVISKIAYQNSLLKALNLPKYNSASERLYI